MSQSMPNWLKQRAFLTPDRPALYFGENSWTFSQLYEAVQLEVAFLEKQHIKHGDYVGVLVRNTERAVFFIHALQQIGAIAVLLNHRLTSMELLWQLEDAQAKYVVYDPMFQPLIESFKGVHTIPMTDHEHMMSRSGRETFVLEEVCSVMYTSGTTGRPKGVLQTYGNHWWSATGSALNLGIHEQDCWLCAVPLFHISGYSIVIRSVVYGIAVRLYEQFDEQMINQALQRGEGTIISVVSAMLKRMLDQLTGAYHPSFRCMLLGGGPAPKPLLETCAANEIPVYQTYGMTETASQIVTLPPEYSLTKLGSAGKPLFPCQLKIADGKQEGEILVKGPNVTSGYLRREEANRESFSDGWFYTGDIGYLDEEGFLYVLDRRSDLIISGGENVYPAEIESVLLAHPAIVDAGVIGVADDQWGQVPVAFIVVKEPLSEVDVQAFCSERLAKYKCPSTIFVVEQLPRNAAKKLMRRELKTEYEKRKNQ
ncbi:o-succinylbenzoate--CoA ligase [Bacillus sp. REN10]|uniref:o-succinylbenzoate--CoA ligase n=1 Tax=Bacillus sp. REN10 TaxID=2782541 RepID=UPI00193B9FEE|nr:o-succinylbenzoate--CoA ligase [Bacillus sp. REN10]